MTTTTNNTHATCNVAGCNTLVQKEWSETLCYSHAWQRTDTPEGQCIVEGCSEMIEPYYQGDDTLNRLCLAHYEQDIEYHKHSCNTCNNWN